MILEVAPLKIRPGEAAAFEHAFAVASRIIAGMSGYRSHELQRCLERPDEYILLVRWNTLADHEIGFRGSTEYQEWKRLLHHFYDPFPTVSHYDLVHADAGADSHRRLFSTGSVYEPLIGCSRAVRTGGHLAISACAPLAADGKTTAAPDAYGQAKRCLAIIAGVVADAGFALADVVKTRVYFKSYDDWEAIAKAHGEVFGAIRPACGFIQVVGFASPEWHLEIEADCHRTRE